RPSIGQAENEPAPSRPAARQLQPFFDSSRRNRGDSVGILLVDDLEETRSALQRLPTGRGHVDVRTAGDGTEALALLALDGARLDVVVTDVDMPGLDGIEVCQRIKADATRHDIPVLILTGLRDGT